MNSGRDNIATYGTMEGRYSIATSKQSFRSCHGFLKLP
jgi:hypothetical protein